MNFIPAVQALAPATDSAWCFAFVEGQLLMPELEGAAFAPQRLSSLHILASAHHYLGQLDALDCWALVLPATPPGWRPVPLRAAMMSIAEPLIGVASRAAQILEWDRAHRHCGVCGTATRLHAQDRARVCPACAHVSYPRLSPSMMVLVWREQQLLLARSPRFAPGVYSALAGFVEAGESLEECVHREVAEEVSVRVTDLRYYGSQSWPFPHSLMVAYTALWVGGEIVPQAGEIEHAAWFDIDALPKIPPRFSISGHLIRDTVAMLSGTPP